MGEYQSGNKLPDQLMPFIWHYLKNKKWCLFGMFLAASIWAFEMSFSPYLLKIIIDTTIQYAQTPNKLVTAILTPCVLYAAMSMILNLNLRFFDYIRLMLLPKVKVDINKDMLAYVLGHSTGFFQNAFSGNLTKKIADISENVEQLIRIISGMFIPIIMGLIMACFTLYKTVNPLFGSILFIWSILFVYFTYIASKGTVKYSRSFSESISTMMGTVSDSLSNISSIKLYNNITHEISHIDRNATQVVKHDRALQWYNLKINFFQGIGLTTLISTMLTTLMIGAKQSWISPGDFALVLTLSMTFMGSIYGIGNQIQLFSKLVGTCNQALSIIETPHEVTDAPDATTLLVTKGEITFDHVLFAYENVKPLFNQLTITINPGEKVGLLGYSGGGKSTFIKLILRFMDTQAGMISIDNQNIKMVTQHSLREQIATIQQEPELFHRTIMENIRFANVKASDEAVIEAAKKARCHEFILEFPEQYNAMVGERGVKLSGGQKQRIAIARAFLKNAPILLLDEATSSLDSITESYIHEALQAVMANKTTLVIAHRLSTLNNMDRLLVFVDGQIIEDGSLTSLLANENGYFYKLWHMQAKGFLPA